MSSTPSSSSPSAATPRAGRAVDWGRYALVGLGTVVAAVVANLIVWAIGGAIVGYDPRFSPLASPGGAFLFTLVPAIVATLIYAGLLRFAADPARVFTILAVVLLVLSLIPDLTYIPTVPGASVRQTAVLMAMHVVAAVVIVGGLTRVRPVGR